MSKLITRLVDICLVFIMWYSLLVLIDRPQPIYIVLAITLAWYSYFVWWYKRYRKPKGEQTHD